jgi:hypothetical protein
MLKLDFVTFYAQDSQSAWHVDYAFAAFHALPLPLFAPRQFRIPAFCFCRANMNNPIGESSFLFWFCPEVHQIVVWPSACCFCFCFVWRGFLWFCLQVLWCTCVQINPFLQILATMLPFSDPIRSTNKPTQHIPPIPQAQHNTCPCCARIAGLFDGTYTTRTAIKPLSLSSTVHTHVLSHTTPADLARVLLAYLHAHATHPAHPAHTTQRLPILRANCLLI